MPNGKKFAIAAIKERSCQTPKGNSKEGLYRFYNICLFYHQSKQKNIYFLELKEKSCPDNAKYHSENSAKYIVKLDLKGFFPSVTFESILKFFEKRFEMQRLGSKTLAKNFNI